MCGIAGIFGYHPSSPPVDVLELDRLRDSMASRGPDGAGTWISPRRDIGLAHRRLSILDLSPEGAQPMANTTLGLRIVFNGEIYNHASLRRELGLDPTAFRSHSDTETLLHLYQRYGVAMLPRLRGMFAFAIWDSNTQRLLLARDSFGMKPLYFADDGKSIRFASQVRTLRMADGVDLRPDPAAQAGFHLLGYVPDPHTLHRGIRALQAGTYLEVDCSGPRRAVTFFDAREVLLEGQAQAPSLDTIDQQERISQGIRDSVKAHLLSDVPVGVFLSSGIDSCTIASLASPDIKEMQTLTLGFREFEGTPQDETPLAAAMAASLASGHHIRRMGREDFLAHLEAGLNAMDQPSIDGLNTYFVSLAAAQIGLKVALSGLGGDELFGGYPSFHQVPRLSQSLAPLGHFPTLGRVFRKVWAPTLGHFTPPKYASLLELGPSLTGAYLLRRGLYMPWELPALMGPEAAKEGWESLALLDRLDATIEGLHSDRARLCALETAWYMRGQLLRDSDWAGMAHGLEIRVPLVDVDLFKALAPLQSLDAPPSKAQLAASTRIPLPSAILNRPKTGFSIPIREWALNSLALSSKEAGLRGWARHLLARAFPSLEAA